MKTITLLPDVDYEIKDNEFYIYKNTKVKVSAFSYIDRKTLIATTANLEGVKQLDRKAFVKKEDVEEFGDSYNNHFQNSIVSIEEDSAFRGGFYAGYNANKGEFTLEQFGDAMEQAIQWAWNNPKGDVNKFIHSYIKEIQPLSLPTSIIVDESYNITKVNW